MDIKKSKPMCWEITGCGRTDSCKVLALAKSTGQPCWEAVIDFHDYRSALNVCGDCVVSVLSKEHSLTQEEINDIKQCKSTGSSHCSCPGLLS